MIAFTRPQERSYDARNFACDAVLVLDVAEDEHRAVAVADEEIRRRQLPAGRAASRPSSNEELSGSQAMSPAAAIVGPSIGGTSTSRRGDAGVVLERGENEGDRERDGCSEDD